MQRSENDIGCLQGSIDRVSVGLSGGVQRISEELQGEISRVSGGIVGYISLVCTVGRDAYLNVSTDVLWLAPEMLGEEFDIYSNVNWKIE